MYKRFSIEDIGKIQNNLVTNLYNILKKEDCPTLIDFFKKIFKEGNDIYYFNRSDILFRFSKKEENTIVLSDEREKIEVILDESQQRELHNMLKMHAIKKNKTNTNNGQKSIEQILLDEFSNGQFSKINGKKYLVYDIETTGNIENLKEVKLTIAYSMEPNNKNKMTYEYIDQNNLKDFVQKMIDFDGYIIGFNNIRFDNPICIYNAGIGEDSLRKINEKSIDIYVLIQSLSGKRMGLNKISEALVGISKTLESGAEGENLFNKYLETGKIEYLETLKNYCKNDVRMTALVFLYLIHFKKIYIEGEEINFSLEDIVNKSGPNIKTEKENQNKSIF